MRFLFMKWTSSALTTHSLLVALSLGLTTLPVPAPARDLIQIPIPSPGRVVGRARGLVHRVANGIAGTDQPSKRSRSKSATKPNADTARPPEGVQEVTKEPPPSPSEVIPPGETPLPPVSPTAPASVPAPQTNATRKSTAPAPATLPAPRQTGPEYARPVPGKKGLVYPPGEVESTATMIDVRDMAPGQLVKDPRTGKTFRVPAATSE
jgi:hypothetical protein